MNELFERIKEAFLNIWNKLTKIQRILAGVSLVSFFALIFIFSYLSNRVVYTPLFTDLDPKDASKIKAQLDKDGVEYKLSGGGSIIEVNEKVRYSLRLDLANEGLVPEGGSVGFEIFDNSKIGATEFDKKIMLQRAVKGELERTIKAIEIIKNVKVHIVQASDSVFADEQTPAKASVFLTLMPFQTLTEENIKSIMLLTAGGVKGLSIENIEVIGSNGEVYSDKVDFDDGTIFSGKVITMQNEQQKNMEKKLERSAGSVLSVLGGGNYRVEVSVELDFNVESQDREIYTTPTVGGEQLTEGLVRSKQEGNEKYSGKANAQPEGVTGTSSNIPGYIATEGDGSNKEYEKSQNTVNYELNKTIAKFEKSVGQIKKMTISVVLNKNARYFRDSEGKARDFTPAEKLNFENMVKNAVSFNSLRGDTINVTALPFDTTVEDQYKQAIDQENRNRQWIFIGMAVFIFIIIAIIIAMQLMKRAEEKRLREKERLAVEELIPEFENIALGDQLSVEEQERKEKEDEIKSIAKNKPEEVATLIRSWMLDD